ncbi:ribosomal L7Ae/L30e/S12e/Gadd45 family protein [Candidatus Parvarchaeota archaeon]|nr:ribosomal L7Ae/L30e/S12e/Gadd45 family protein [Candidatus Parvarchaeota archaeon]
MEKEIEQKMRKKIANKEVYIGMNSTVRAYNKKDLDFIVYAKNISRDMLSALDKLEAKKYVYDGDSEALSIACAKSFNICVLGVKK